jgi:hypothetical protein
MKQRPWGVHALSDFYHPDVQAGLPDGRWVAAVSEPYTANRLVAAWWVLTGRAVAFQWPKPGDLEAIFQKRRPDRIGQKPRPFVSQQIDKTKWMT